MLTTPVAPPGSQLPISACSRRVKTPPYCGVPRLSHQFPVTVVVVGVVVVTAVMVAVVVVGVVEIEVLVVVVTNVIVDVADLVQDAKTRDVITRKVSTIQPIPLFIQTPLLFCNT